MEKRELIIGLQNVCNELSATKQRISRAECCINEIFKKVELEGTIQDPTLDQIIGVLNSIVIELKNLRGRSQEE